MTVAGAPVPFKWLFGTQLLCGFDLAGPDDRDFFVVSRTSTAEFRRLCSVNYQNLDLQFHASGSKSFGLTAPGFRMGCGFEATGGAYTG